MAERFPRHIVLAKSFPWLSRTWLQSFPAPMGFNRSLALAGDYGCGVALGGFAGISEPVPLALAGLTLTTPIRKQGCL